MSTSNSFRAGAANLQESGDVPTSVVRVIHAGFFASLDSCRKQFTIGIVGQYLQGLRDACDLLHAQVLANCPGIVLGQASSLRRIKKCDVCSFLRCSVIIDLLNVSKLGLSIGLLPL